MTMTGLRHLSIDNSSYDNSSAATIARCNAVLPPNNASAARSPISHILKRMMELIISLSVVIGFAPVFAILIVLVSLDGGPAFYAQRRIGRGGRIFKCWKFRTMHVNADEMLAVLLATDEKARQEYTRIWKLKDDPRITRVGRFLRRYSLDELPQILNVIEGDM